MMPMQDRQRPDVPSSPQDRAFDRITAAEEGLARKTEVHYRKGDGSRCADCEYWDGEGACEKVAGRIAPDAVCDLYEKAEPEKMPSTLGDDNPPGDEDERHPR